MSASGQNWTEISDSTLRANFAVLQASAGPEMDVLAVIKSDAYAHGATRCAPVLAAAGARWLGVTHAAEGARVRRALAAGPGLSDQPQILTMCGPLPGDAALCVEHGLTPAIWTAEQAALLAGTGLPVHVEVDTGMCRQGARPGAELAATLDAMAAAGLRLDGLFTHFLDAEVPGSARTPEQQRLFGQAVEQVRARGLQPGWIHAGASSTVDHPVTPADWLPKLARGVGARAMVRPGLALYGYCLPLARDGQPQVRPELQPVLRWYARVLAVRALAPGDTVGYNGLWTAPAPVRVALLGVGYADGLRRELSGSDVRPGGWVLLHGRRAPVLGRISMNLTVVDISAIPGVEAGDAALLLGPGLTADEHARLAGTIAYEILCGIHPCR